MLPWRRIYSNRNKQSSFAAFSLVELLMAVAIFSVVSIAIYSTFSSGAAVLRRINNLDLVQQKILLKTEKLSRQMREQPASRKPLFKGDKTKISFSANVDYFPCRLTYYFDSPTNSLLYVADKLSEIIDQEGKLDPNLKSSGAVYLSKIKEVSFSYLYLDLSKNTYFWTDKWEQEYLPFAVKFTIIGQKQKYESTVYLPKN